MSNLQKLLFGFGGGSGTYTPPTPPVTDQKSLRFRSTAPASLSRTIASAGNRQKWTWSAWVKRGAFLPTQQELFMCYSPADNRHFNFGFDSNQRLTAYSFDVGGIGTRLWGNTSKAMYRDASAWYHIVITMDTVQAVAANRVKIYVNGDQVTSFSESTYPAQNTNEYVNAANGLHRIGSYIYGAFQQFDGYMSDIAFADGQALTPTSFGQVDLVTGQWTPKDFSGPFGTTGYYLRFQDSSALTTSSNVGLGKDTSSNGNFWITNNISITAGNTYDAMNDSPAVTSTAGNYAVLNRLSFVVGDFSITNGNLDVGSSNAPTSETVVSTLSMSAGKWYCEVTINSQTDAGVVGIAPATARPNQGFYNQVGGIAYYPHDGTKFIAGTVSAYGTAANSGDVIGIAVDFAAQTITFYKNGVSMGAISTPFSGEYVFACGDGSGSTGLNYTFNFGQRPFAYSAPADHNALHTGNLATPTIVKSNAYFNAISVDLGSTDYTTYLATTPGFIPDLVVYKSKSFANNSMVYDSVRGPGATQELNTNTSLSVGTGLDTFTYGYIVNFVNGYLESAAGSGTNPPTNTDYNKNVCEPGRTYVSWMWKKGVTPGFDVVQYAGTGYNQGISHSLGAVPKMMWIKNIDSSAVSWGVYFYSLPITDNLYLNLDYASTNNGLSVWTGVAPTSTTFYVDTWAGVNENFSSHIAYLWSEVPGFSKFGTYIGNGNENGPFVNCGFRPAYVMVKCISSAGDWVVIDSSRDKFNSAPMVAAHALFLNVPLAEDPLSVLSIDFTATGFKVRTIFAPANSNGQTYMFAAFAEAPTKFALAR
jgi:hypothetical protein